MYFIHFRKFFKKRGCRFLQSSSCHLLVLRLHCREEDCVSDGTLVCKKHYQSVDSVSDASSRRKTDFKYVDEFVIVRMGFFAFFNVVLETLKILFQVLACDYVYAHDHKRSDSYYKRGFYEAHFLFLLRIKLVRFHADGSFVLKCAF